jgi:hypothetical protein
MPLRGSNAAATLIAGTALAVTTNGTTVSSGSNATLVAYLNVTAVTGEAPTLNVKIQDSPDGTTWYDVPSATFTEAAATTTERKVFTNVGDYIRAVATIAGDTPAFTFTVKATSIT